MARLARVVIPGCPHHVVQRGVRSMRIFADDGDRMEYLRLLKLNAAKHGIYFMAYCLMTNHVHLIAVPEREDSLARGIGEAHRLYTLGVNLRAGARGYLFQGRFFSCPMDERHSVAAIAYAERNPVRAGMAAAAWDYMWSSAGVHAGLSPSNSVLEVQKLQFSGAEWGKILCRDPENIGELRQHFRTGRPLGTEDFKARAEILCGRRLRCLPAGRKKAETFGEIGIVSPN